MDSLLAYIDPGSGSLIIQAAIAAVIAIPVFFRSQIARVFRAFRGSGDDASGGDAPGANPAGGDDDAARSV
jgi:hypothetical protein